MSGRKKNVTFDEIFSLVRSFREERGWLGLTPEDLAKSIVLEAAELLEHFQWDSTEVKKHKEKAAKDKDEIALEAADVFIYLLDFCQESNIDLLKSTVKKIKRNSQKYPTKEMKAGDHKAYSRAKNYRKNNNRNQ